jgi:hypothetical protein
VSRTHHEREKDPFDGRKRLSRRRVTAATVAGLGSAEELVNQRVGVAKTCLDGWNMIVKCFHSGPNFPGDLP